jgi:hypothetical protein
MMLTQVPTRISQPGSPTKPPVRLNSHIYLFAADPLDQVHFGWYYLGPAATNSNDAYGVVVDENLPGTLGQVSDWVQVWSDAGSGKGTDFSLWRGIPDNPAHVVLGGMFVRSHNKPTIDESRYIRTIDKDVLVTVKATPEIWNDMGSGARAEGAVWGISTAGNTKAINTGAVQGYNNPPGVAYALDSTKVIVVGQVCPHTSSASFKHDLNVFTYSRETNVSEMVGK